MTLSVVRQDEWGIRAVESERRAAVEYIHGAICDPYAEWTPEEQAWQAM